MNFGLSIEQQNALRYLFSKFPEVEKCIIYGSRARGDNKRYSDIDLTIIGDLKNSSLTKIENDIDDLLLPYKVDLSLFTSITNTDLKNVIIRDGKEFYTRN